MMSRNRLMVLLFVLAALVASACGSDEGAPAGGSGEPVGEASESPAGPSPSPTDEAVEFRKYELWFARPDGVSVTFRYLPAEAAIATAVMEQLLGGTTSGETDADLTTLIPEGTELLDLSISDGTARVDLSSEFADGGGSASMLGRVAQVVYTLTQFDTVKDVKFLMEGEPVTALGGEGLALDGPQTRDDYASELHPIQVYEPVVGDELTPPITVSGTANVFEATVSLRLVTESGDVLAEDFTTATCGTGCVGDFETEISFDLDGDVPAYLEVFESSAENGEPIHMVRIPLALFPN